LLQYNVAYVMLMHMRNKNMIYSHIYTNRYIYTLKHIQYDALM
jgi:uncharacterized protein YebE (UPF0316 family)